jgi:hypothetical protein
MAVIGQEVAAARTTQAAVAQTEVAQAVDGGLATQSSAPVISLGPNIDRLKFTGDLLLRFERRDRDDDTAESGDDMRLQRWRTRLRLGAVWTYSSGSAIGTSANDTWNEDAVFETGGIGLDYAYARHHWQDLTFTVGQQKNPFRTTYILFDSDMRPTGATLQASHDFGCGSAFATLGAYNVRAAAENEDLADMVAAQVGVQRDIGGKGSALLAVGLYKYDSATSQQFFTETKNDDYSWELFDVYAEVGRTFGPVKLTLYGEYVNNLSVSNDHGSQLFPEDAASSFLSNYEPEDNNMAWVAGVKASYKRLRLNYSYAHIEGDSVPAFQTDGTFANGLSDTNVAGHVVKLKYMLTPHCHLGANAFLTTWIEDNDYQYDSSNIFQVDLGYRF